MPNILFVVPRFHTNLFFATRALAEAGYGVAVFTTARLPGEDHSVVTPVVFGSDPDPVELREAWRSAAPDLVFLRKAGRVTRLAEQLARAHRVPALVYEMRSLVQRRSFGQRLWNRLRGKPQRRVTPSRGLDATKTDPDAIYLPWPVAPLPTPVERGDAPGLKLLCVGKLGQTRKRHDRVVEAIERFGLADRVALTIIGASPRRPLASDAHYRKVLGYDALPWITVRADVPFAAMADLYAAHDACILPSVGEPLGTAPIEGMAYGCIPLISTAAGSAGVVTPGEDGLLVDPDDPATIASAIERLADDPALRSRLSAGARRTAEGELGPARFVARVAALLPA